MDMDQVFGDPSKDQTPQGEPEVVVEQPVTDEQQQPEAAAPPAADTNGHHVPLAALEAERKGRQDWKEKALRLEGELKARDQMVERQQQPQEQDPIKAAEQRFTNLLLDQSERMARRTYGDDVVNAAFQKFQEAAKANPFLGHQAGQSTDPWDFVVQEGKRLELLEKIGKDPAAYEENLKKQWLAEQQAQPSEPRAPLPASLAGARSVAQRQAPAYSGPPPINSLFNN